MQVFLFLLRLFALGALAESEVDGAHVVQGRRFGWRDCEIFCSKNRRAESLRFMLRFRFWHPSRSFVSGPSRPDTHPHAPKRRAWGHTRIGGLLFAQKQTPYVGSRFPNRGYFGAFLSNETHRGGGQLDYGIAVGSYEELGRCCFYTECQNKMIRVCSV